MHRSSVSCTCAGLTIRRAPSIRRHTACHTLLLNLLHNIVELSRLNTRYATANDAHTSRTAYIILQFSDASTYILLNLVRRYRT